MRYTLFDASIVYFSSFKLFTIYHDFIFGQCAQCLGHQLFIVNLKSTVHPHEYYIKIKMPLRIPSLCNSFKSSPDTQKKNALVYKGTAKSQACHCQQ